MRYAHATALFPRNIARLVNAAAYTGPVAAPSPEYVKAMRDRDARAFWDSAVSTTTPNGRLLGSRYQGGSIGTPRSR